jgi:hypothetical protein
MPPLCQKTRRCTPCVGVELAALTLALALSGCGRNPTNLRVAPTTEAARVDWTNPDLSANLGGGWTARHCDSDKAALCLSKDGTLAGKLSFKDIPSQGEEKTTSSEQIQAVLAVRTQTDYALLRLARSLQCGDRYELHARRPKPVAIAGLRGLKSQISGSLDGRLVELGIGYRIYRDGIESLLWAAAGEPRGCFPVADGAFTPDQLRSVEARLDRLVARLRLPAATHYSTPEPPKEQG